MKQGTREWFEARAGKVTASRIADVMNFLKRSGEEGADRRAYKAQIIVETITGEPTMEGYLSPYMQWGTEHEDAARSAYELRGGALVDQVGLVDHPTIPRAAASPDGYVGDDGLLEIKCPKTETHIGYLLADVVPSDYLPQMYFQLACTGREWCDFASFDPRLPGPLRLYVKRLWRDPDEIAKIEQAVLQFLFEVDKTIEQLQIKCGKFDVGKTEPAPLPEGEGWITETDEEIEELFR
jgi:putative phage-type endonuclease